MPCPSSTSTEVGPRAHVPALLIAAYAAPGIGFGASQVMVSLFLPAFYADTLGVPLGQIGAATTAVQIFDAMTDPLLGHISDKCRATCGRRRPFLLIGGLGLAASFVTLFSPPDFRNPSSALVFVTALGLATQFFLTVARIPWTAWAIELTSEYDEKTKLSSVREFMWVLGAMLGAVLPSIMGTIVDESQRLSLAAGFWAVTIVASSALCFCCVRDEVPSAPGDSAHTVSSQIAFARSIACSRAGAALYAATVLVIMATSSNAILFPFFVKYILQDEGGTEWLLGLYIFLGAVFVPFWAWVAKQADKKRTLVFITLVQSSVLLLIFAAVDSGAFSTYVACIISAGSVMGGSAVVRFSMMADVADMLQLQTGGGRDEGKIVGLFDVSAKLAASGLVALGFLAIDLSGYQVDAMPQTAAASFAIRLFYALVPSILALFSAIVIWTLYPLNRAQHAEILAKLSFSASFRSVSTRKLNFENAGC
ncbi:yjmB [Symbiodinium natans]|uniref:YjmB protein n=1 Tax=Symbiodinium natans TaxID=878477 RepID=A0A812V9R2_9DINO|nr:yjmB [Symbiodinium natans]